MDKHDKNKKNGIRKLGSDQEFLKAFLQEEKPGHSNGSGGSGETMNRHGIPFVEDYETRFVSEEAPKTPDPSGPDIPEEEEDFARLLAESLNERPPGRKPVKPVPLKKRLRRYPGPEADLDLHGFTAIGAQARARSFIESGLHQGYFTLRIIVGKGTHSPEGPVLPQVVEDLVKEMKTQRGVLSWEWEGGSRKKSGALIVYLNRFND